MLSLGVLLFVTVGPREPKGYTIAPHSGRSTSVSTSTSTSATVSPNTASPNNPQTATTGPLASVAPPTTRASALTTSQPATSTDISVKAGHLEASMARCTDLLESMLTKLPPTGASMAVAERWSPPNSLTNCSTDFHQLACSILGMARKRCHQHQDASARLGAAGPGVPDGGHLSSTLDRLSAGQSGACDGGGTWKDPAWYDGGFTQGYDANGLTPLSYWNYLQAVVDRYKDSPALGMWEPMSEAEASTCPPQFQPSNCGGHQTCPNKIAAESALRHFFDTVGGEIHTLDPNHLVESGTIGSGQCGTSGPDYAAVSASPGIDVCTMTMTAQLRLVGISGTGSALRFKEAATLGKPIIGGEVGLMAGNGRRRSNSSEQRSSQFRVKEEAQLEAGSSGLLCMGLGTSGTLRMCV